MSSTRSTISVQPRALPMTHFPLRCASPSLVRPVFRFHSWLVPLDPCAEQVGAEALQLPAGVDQALHAPGKLLCISVGDVPAVVADVELNVTHRVFIITVVHADEPYLPHAPRYPNLNKAFAWFPNPVTGSIS